MGFLPIKKDPNRVAVLPRSGAFVKGFFEKKLTTHRGSKLYFSFTTPKKYFLLLFGSNFFFYLEKFFEEVFTSH